MPAACPKPGLRYFHQDLAGDAIIFASKRLSRKYRDAMSMNGAEGDNTKGEVQFLSSQTPLTDFLSVCGKVPFLRQTRRTLCST